MIFLEKLLGQKILSFIGLLILSSILFFSKDVMLSQFVGLIMFLIAFFNIIYEIKLRYWIKTETKNDIQFKSNGERDIADYFSKKKIKFIYEPKLTLKSPIPLKPDFFLPEFDVYVEYWGRWNIDFNYKQECRIKKEQYIKGEIKLVELYPDNLKSINQLDWKFTQRLLNILKRERV
ncbi:MAG TPA: hypothetical protein VJH20_03950 [Candidatus Nanoarchaeia archaeon]|nr:hypothetical protein [Candidatus Nanoarchaeia archaeon]